MGAHDGEEARGRKRPGEQVIAGRGGGPAGLLTRGGDLADGLEPRKAVVFGEPGDVVDDRGAAGLDAAVVAIGGGGEVVRRGLWVVEQQPHVLVQRRLVGLERQSVGAAAVENRLRRILLTVHGVGGDDAAIERQQGEQRRHGRDLVRLGGDPQLAEHQARLACPGADQVQGPFWRSNERRAVLPSIATTPATRADRAAR